MVGSMGGEKTKAAVAAEPGGASDVAGRGDDRAAVVWRLTIAACVLTYIAVFLVGLQTGAAPDAATLKGGVAMMAVAVLGSVAIATVGSPAAGVGPRAGSPSDPAARSARTTPAAASAGAPEGTDR